MFGKGHFGFERGTFPQFAKEWGAMASLAHRFLHPCFLKDNNLQETHAGGINAIDTCWWHSY